MSAIPGQDRIRLLESRMDLQTLDTSADLIAQAPPLREALGFHADNLRAKRAALLVALLANSREHVETIELAEQLHGRVELLIREYDYGRQASHAALLVYSPSRAPDPVALAKRQGIMAKVYARTPSELRRMGSARAVAELESITAALLSTPELVALGLHDGLVSVLAECQDLVTRHRSERREDLAATAHLDAARADFDLAHTAYALFVESLLTLRGERARIGRFVYAQEPAYKARRLQGAPVAQEPGIGAVDAELGDPSDPDRT